MPVNISKMSKKEIEELTLNSEIRKLDLPQISQKNILHRKADIEDFKASIDSPTVLPAFLELYVKF
jgi:hypothetical protein